MSAIEIAKEDNPRNSRAVKLFLEPSGLRMATDDIGTNPVSRAGGDYEFWVDVKVSDFPLLLVALLTDKYCGNLRATDELRKFCDENSIPNSWESWP